MLDEVNQQKLIITPAMLFNEIPNASTIRDSIKHSRHEIRQIINGKDNRLLIVVGPCSIHDTDAALEFANLLQLASQRFADDLLLVMRVYFEKPRTTLGWKGLISDPNLDGSHDTNLGLRLARKLLLDLAHLGVPTATEFLDTITPQYLSDLVCWSAIGARTSESQVHRELASGLTMPVGFKNTTGGNVKVAIDAVNTAKHPHHFLSINQDGAPVVVSTKGNDACHIILRGANESTNYMANEINHAAKLLVQAGLPARLMVDCSHGNSMRHYQNQIAVGRALAQQIARGDATICGVMMESNLVAGNQRLGDGVGLTYGQSVTDGCVAWEDTVGVLEELAVVGKVRVY